MKNVWPKCITRIYTASGVEFGKEAFSPVFFLFFFLFANNETLERLFHSYDKDPNKLPKSKKGTQEKLRYWEKNTGNSNSNNNQPPKICFSLWKIKRWVLIYRRGAGAKTPRSLKNNRKDFFYKNGEGVFYRRGVSTAFH